MDHSRFSTARFSIKGVDHRGDVVSAKLARLRAQRRINRGCSARHVIRYNKQSVVRAAKFLSRVTEKEREYSSREKAIIEMIISQLCRENSPSCTRVTRGVICPEGYSLVLIAEEEEIDLSWPGQLALRFIFPPLSWRGNFLQVIFFLVETRAIAAQRSRRVIYLVILT